MSLNASKVKGGGDFVEQDLLDAGVYPGRVVQVIDLGLQVQRAFQGKDKAPANEISLTYELTDEFMKDKDGKEDETKPRWVSESFPLFNLKADRAKSTQRYLALDPNEVHGGDFAAVVDIPVQISLVHNKKGDKTYVNVANIAAMRQRDADKCPPLVNPPKVFDLDDPDMDVFLKLPEWLQEKIKSNLNFNGSPLQKKLGGLNDQPVQQKKEEVGKKGDDPIVDADVDTSAVWD